MLQLHCLALTACCLVICLSLILVLQIVAMYAFNKSKYADDPDCDIDFETMRLA